jgi:hypothetical protein
MGAPLATTIPHATLPAWKLLFLPFYGNWMLVFHEASFCAHHQISLSVSIAVDVLD